MSIDAERLLSPLPSNHHQDSCHFINFLIEVQSTATHMTVFEDPIILWMNLCEKAFLYPVSPKSVNAWQLSALQLARPWADALWWAASWLAERSRLLPTRWHAIGPILPHRQKNSLKSDLWQERETRRKFCSGSNRNRILKDIMARWVF